MYSSAAILLLDDDIWAGRRSLLVDVEYGHRKRQLQRELVKDLIDSNMHFPEVQS